MPIVQFSIIDWIVLAAYLVGLIGTGIYLARRQSTDTTDYFLAGRSMPTWAVAISILATVQSAATFIGGPESSYRNNLTYLSLSLGPIIAALIAAWLFIPAYWRAGVTTPYELLQARFGIASRRVTSVVYLLGQVMGCGARTFIGALPLAMVLFGDAEPTHVLIAVGAITLLGATLTLAGGVSSVIWTDVLQVAVYLGAALAALIVLYNRIPMTTGEMLQTLSAAPSASGSKLTLIDASWPPDLSKSQTLWTAIGGIMLLNLAVLTTNQDFVQRALSCKSPAEGARSVIVSALVGVPVVMLFLAIGLLLFLFYKTSVDQQVASGAAAAMPESKNVFQTFILTQMPSGLAGLMIAGVLAVGPAGINATLNSMSSAIINDLYRPLRPARDERHYVSMGRAGVVLSAIAVGAFACASVFWHQSSQLSLVDFALNVMGFAYAGLLGVFTIALLTKRGNDVSAIAALVAGASVMILLEPTLWRWWSSHIPWGVDTTTQQPRTLASITIAYPWHLVTGTLVAMAVCALGRPKPGASLITRSLASTATSNTQAVDS